MRKWAGPLIALGLACLVPGRPYLADRSVAAPGSFPQSGNFAVEGKITRLAEGKITVNTEENIIFHIVYTEKTEFKHQDGSAASSKELRIGLRIKVSGDLDESGEIAAARVEIQSAPPQKKPS